MAQKRNASRRKKTGTKKRQQGPPPGTAQVNTYLPFDDIDKIHALWTARKSQMTWSPRLCEVYQDVVRLGLRAMDPETGWPKRAAAERIAAPSIQVPDGQPVFASLLTPEQLADERELVRLMDESWMMLWAGRPNLQNFHANSKLLEYCGCDAMQFRWRGWVELVHTDDRQRVMQTCISGFASQKSFRLVYRLRRRDGLYGVIVDYVEPRFSLEGRFAGCIGTMYQLSVEGVEQYVNSPIAPAVYS